jgi:hypothetical protein
VRVLMAVNPFAALKRNKTVIITVKMFFMGAS